MVPTSQQVVIRGALENVSIAFRNPSYIGDQVYPIINGLNRRTQVALYDRQPWFRIGADWRSEGTTAKRGDYSITTKNIDPKQVAFGKAVTDELLFASQEPMALPIQPIQESLIFCADQIDLFKEYQIAQNIFAQTWADGVGGGTGLAGAWASTDSSTNTFVTDVLAGKIAVQSRTGLVPNTLVIDYGTFTKLQTCPAVLDRIKYTQTGVITEQLIAALLQLDTVLVGKAIYTTAKETQPESSTVSMLNVWESSAGKGNAFLFYRPPSAGLRTPSPGYQYRLEENGAWRRSVTYREEWNHQSIYEVMEWVDIRAMMTDLGYLWKNTISS